LSAQAQSLLYETDRVEEIVKQYAASVASLMISDMRSELAELIEEELSNEDGFEDVQVRITSVMIQNV
jgi:hypothetical protein